MSSPQSSRLGEGSVVDGRYRLLASIGEGGFGVVYRAVHLETGREVALKVLQTTHAEDATASKRFRREAALAQRLRHPNVVELLDYGETDRGVPFIAFELLRGLPLNEVLGDCGALPIDQVVAIASELLAAVHSAHELGIVHRDLKPQNIFLVDTPPHTKVLDFGVAKAVTGEGANATQLTASGQMVGTPHYMAPEQVRGGDVGPPADVYALGLVIAEMLQGERLVRGESIIDVYLAHISEVPLPIPERVAGSALGSMIGRATAKPLGQRYASAGEMQRELAEVVARIGHDVRPNPLKWRKLERPRAASGTLIMDASSIVGAPASGVVRARERFDATTTDRFSLDRSASDEPASEGAHLRHRARQVSEESRLALAASFAGAVPSGPAPRVASDSLRRLSPAVAAWQPAPASDRAPASVSQPSQGPALAPAPTVPQAPEPGNSGAWEGQLAATMAHDSRSAQAQGEPMPRPPWALDQPLAAQSIASLVYADGAQASPSASAGPVPWNGAAASRSVDDARREDRGMGAVAWLIVIAIVAASAAAGLDFADML